MMINKIINEIAEIESLILSKNEDSILNNNYTLKSMKEHSEEISCLFKHKDQHWKKETIDLIIHCFLLLQRNSTSFCEAERIFCERVNKFKLNIKNNFKKSVI